MRLLYAHTILLLRLWRPAGAWLRAGREQGLCPRIAEARLMRARAVETSLRAIHRIHVSMDDYTARQAREERPNTAELTAPEAAYIAHERDYQDLCRRVARARLRAGLSADNP